MQQNAPTGIDSLAHACLHIFSFYPCKSLSQPDTSGSTHALAGRDNKAAAATQEPAATESLEHMAFWAWPLSGTI